MFGSCDRLSKIFYTFWCIFLFWEMKVSVDA
jgi:hypothetical protein